eukprot:3044993-Pleurochrysis_carterae.AAC.1
MHERVATNMRQGVSGHVPLPASAHAASAHARSHGHPLHHAPPAAACFSPTRLTLPPSLSAAPADLRQGRQRDAGCAPPPE